MAGKLQRQRNPPGPSGSRLATIGASAIPNRSASRSTFPFFRLPRELRDIVYDNLWKHKPIFVVNYAFHPFKVEYPGAVDSQILAVAKGKFKNRSPWIFASKRLLAEAIYQLQSQSSWTLLTRPTTKGCTHPAFSRKSKLLLSPWNAYTVHIDHILLHEYCELEADNQTCRSQVRLKIASSNPLRCLRSNLPPAANLRRLSVILYDEGAKEMSYAATRAEATLQPLDRFPLPKLRDLKLHIELYNHLVANKMVETAVIWAAGAVCVNLLRQPSAAGVDFHAVPKPQTIQYHFHFKKVKSGSTVGGNARPS
ncbi:hypothetical protein CC86DRAFT_400987 [Ophiobolus disseminans]|uniref:Uncharacterized protein n=1 Tax=Ophiobolus disseminans TaxID=1469910 RepID=A0A6A7AG53_9PLEO|nr:hypothetical protein CC86DRAFT_400987 [Ophiobolus disseminans]